MWENIKTVVQSLTNVIVSVSTTMEKSVKLVENEIDNLDAEQKKRLNKIARARKRPSKATSK